MSKRRDIQWLHELAQSRNAKCLSIVYKNNRTKYRWLCKACNVEWSAIPLVKSGCPNCFGTPKKNIEWLHTVALKKEGKCLSTEYINSKTKYLWECSKGHQWEATAQSIDLNSTWCPHCAGNLPKNTDWLHRLAAINNGKCLSTNYVNSSTKYLWECAKGHQWQSSANAVQQTDWCLICSGKSLRNLDFLREVASRKNGRCLSTTYTNIHNKYLWECEKGHTWEADGGDVAYSGNWCSRCSYQQSKGEIDICSYIRSLGVQGVIERDRKAIKPFELDIYIPEKKLAIEYCGLHWHGEIIKGVAASKSHYNKFNKCREANIRLITIWSSEWDTRKEIIKAYLKNILGFFDGMKLSAQKCKIKAVHKNAALKFLESNHIQGFCSGRNIGLYYNDLLVAVLVYKVNKNGIEICRYAADINTHVRGGFSRLVSNLPKDKNIYTFSDNRLSNGNLYQKTGFVKEKEVKPSYWYFGKFSNGPLIHKFRLRRASKDDTSTEKERAMAQKLDRIWDCGLIKWVKPAF